MPMHLRFFGAALFGILAAMLLALVCTTPASAQQQPATENAAAKQPAKVDELLKLLQDPDIQKWLEAQKQNQQAAPATQENETLMLENRMRSKFKAAAIGMPKLPSELSQVSQRLSDERQKTGFLPASIILAAILALGLAGEWAMRRLMRSMHRDGALLGRTYVELAALVLFAAIAVLALFTFEWPPMLGQLLFFGVIAATALHFVMTLGTILVVAEQISGFILRRAVLFCVVLLIAFSLTLLGKALAIDPTAAQAAGFLGSIVLIAICCETVWRRPGSNQSVRFKAAVTAYLIALWLVWAASFHLLCWIGLLAILLPGLLSAMQGLAKALVAAQWPDEKDDTLKAVLIVHGVRTLVIAAAIGWLVFIWRNNPANLQLGGTFVGPMVAGLFRAMVVVLVADFGWRVVKTLLDRRLASVSEVVTLPTEEMARRARLRTLLPILRNGLAAVVLVIVVLTVLAELGVQIGPLIAGAGIFGVAVGFGSQTLVKDIISGVFYLMDDAFRVGEYIQSGSYKGTVESFSLRSIKLRHHRGPVFTVPFGELGAVQNMSRDWAIDKFLLRLTFDADMAKAKKLTKAIGAELLQDEEIGQYIIETLKMKGVEQISDYGIEVAFAFMTAPGWQSVIRRRAYMMLRKSFLDNGIHFAQPTVNVGGDEKSDAAAAALTIATQKQAAIDKAAAAPE